MKLPDHVEHIRTLIYKSFSNQFSRLGIGPNKELEIERIPVDSHNKREKIDVLIKSHIGEVGTYEDAREKALDELTFTLFNRLAAVKVMEAHQLFPPIVTKEAEHGDRSFGHKVWLEEHPEMRNEELEGLRIYFKYEFNKLGEYIPLYHKSYPYALLPYVIDLNQIVDAFNAVEQDAQIESDIWQSDDILGWLYESYNNVKKQAHKDSGDKTEYHKVSLQSQVYTPRWVVEFLVNNSLGKMYLEMYPDSEIKERYKIANAPKTKIRELKPLHEIKLIDPASGSGNFLLYAFNLFYDLYEDQIENYGADYDEDDIAQLIIENNLHGIDLDDRAIQLAQLGLWIKAKQKRRNIGKLNFNIVSSDFYLPEFDKVESIFKIGTTDSKQLQVIKEIWTDLQQAYKFGSLIKIEEKLSLKLHGLVDQAGLTLFGEQEVVEYERFKKEFFKNLEAAVQQFATQQGNSFLTDKTKDAITFLKLLTQKYDVATANPPYTDSSNFGPDLKKFIDANYKNPYRFNTNLYASFILRCFELTNEHGKVAMVHPPTFMYIKTFEDVRKYLLEKSHIDLFVEWGYLGMFHPSARVDAAMYIIDKQKSNNKTYFIKLNHIYEGIRYETFVEAYDKLVANQEHSNNYTLPQSKLKIIKSYPFIYWISDDFRSKFGSKDISTYFDVVQGLATADNQRFLRFWFEVYKNRYPFSEETSTLKWVLYSKGGPFKKWSGNLWTTVNWEDNGYQIRNFLDSKGKQRSRPQNEQHYFSEGVTYTSSGSKGPSFRLLPENLIFDVGGSAIFPKSSEIDVNYLMGCLNSKLAFYILKCLNPTVNTNQGDIKRIPFVFPSEKSKLEVILRSKSCINRSKFIESKTILNPNYNNKLLYELFINEGFRFGIKEWFINENYIMSQTIIDQSIIDDIIFNVYQLSSYDKRMVIEQQGPSIGDLPVCKKAKQAYLTNDVVEFPLNNIKEYIQNLPEKEFTDKDQETILNEFPQLYQSNNDLEEFCIRHQINPINVWYWFKESNIIPKQRMNELAMEFLADLLREILMEDDDGIIPLVPNAGEKILLDRIEEKFIEKGFTMAQYSSFDSVLGRELNDYINDHFFKAFSDHLNLFQYLPKTPFIWHLTSGPEQGFDCYIIIYKWSRDKLMRIRSVYIENRERALINRQSSLKNNDTPAAQNEKDTIYNQLKEIENFKQKIDELLAEGYDPILDDGVGKNIAPLQAKGMLAYEVLGGTEKKGQLNKYLNADW